MNFLEGYMDYKGIYGLDSSLVDCFNAYEKALASGKSISQAENAIDQKLAYYRRVPFIDTKGYIQDILKYYKAHKSTNKNIDQQITKCLNEISPDDFLAKKFNGLEPAALKYLSKIHTNLSKAKSSTFYDRQSKLLKEQKIAKADQLTPKDIIAIYNNLQHFNTTTINWNMSLDHCVNADGSLRTEEAKKCYDYAKSHNLKIRALGAIYPSEELKFDTSALDKQGALKVFTRYMKALSNACPNIECMDILNEMSYDFAQAGKMGEYPKDKPLLNSSFWQEKIGDNYYIELLKIARAEFPSTKFFYNDFGHEDLDKTNNIFKIIDSIKQVEKQENIKLLDGIGLQCRLDSNNTKIDNLQYVIDRANEMGLDIQITELDVVKINKDDNGNMISSEEANKNQESVYRRVHEIAFLNYDKISGITYGDMSDKLSWSANENERYAYIKDASPTVYDKSGKRKENLVTAIVNGIETGIEKNKKTKQDKNQSEDSDLEHGG